MKKLCSSKYALKVTKAVTWLGRERAEEPGDAAREGERRALTAPQSRAAYRCALAKNQLPHHTDTIFLKFILYFLPVSYEILGFNLFNVFAFFSKLLD